jgi:hypothetical protein
VPDSSWAAVVFWADLLADFWSHLGECVRTGQNAQQVMDKAGIASRWSQDPGANAMIFREVMGTAQAENYAPIVDAWPFPASGILSRIWAVPEMDGSILEAHPISSS